MPILALWTTNEIHRPTDDVIHAVYIVLMSSHYDELMTHQKPTLLHKLRFQGEGHCTVTFNKFMTAAMHSISVLHGMGHIGSVL